MRMLNVLMSLSSWSMSAMVWMIMLSTRWTLNLTLAREYAWPRPSCAFTAEPSLRPDTSLEKCRRTPRSRSGTTPTDWHVILRSSWIAAPSWKWRDSELPNMLDIEVIVRKDRQEKIFFGLKGRKNFLVSSSCLSLRITKYERERGGGGVSVWGWGHMHLKENCTPKS